MMNTLKNTFTDTIIPSHSNHPHNIKMSAFHSMIDRLLQIPLNEIDYNSELNIIITIALNNGYPPNSIHNIISKIKFKLLLKQFYTPSISNQETTYKNLHI